MHRESSAAADLLAWPMVGRILRGKHARTLFQIPVLLVSISMILHGLLGPSLSPKNLATTLTWIHFRGLLVLVILCAGNFFCFACPFVLVRDLARKLHAPRLAWPRALRNKWLSIALFVSVLFVYEAFSLWASPWWTAWLILGYFLAILLVDSLFKHGSFCKFVCPIGQFNFVAATLSPLEVQVRHRATCDRCRTKDCIRGTRTSGDLVTIQRGCELALFQPEKVGNLDCTFCLDCVHACPHDNVGIMSRLPGEELESERRRSGIGYLSRRADFGALVTLFTFGALMNAFGMVSPVYAFERWLSRTIHISGQPFIVALLFLMVVVAAPILLLGAAAVIANHLGRLKQRPLRTAVRFSYALAPLGFGMWLAHYGFHLLTGLYTVVPVVQNAVLSVFGMPVLGTPQWFLVGLPVGLVQPIQYGFLALGFLGSLSLMHHYARVDAPQRWLKVFAPWAAIALVMFVAGTWLLGQPMDMRATFLE